MQDKRHVNLVICTPGSSTVSGYTTSLLNSITELSKHNISWTWANGMSSNVADAREITLSGTRENNPEQTLPFDGSLTYDKLVWIDSDITWDPKDLVKLYQSDKDIISGAYLLGNGEVTAYKEDLGRPYLYEEVIQMNEVIKVSSVGFGFLCVKSGVFESMTRPWFQSEIVTHNFRGKDYTFAVLGEDISWCFRARKSGYEIWFDPTIRVIHNKTMQLTWDGIRPC